MQQKERITIQEYARKHRLSIFNVIKMVNAQILESEIVNENGKEKRYIVRDSQGKTKHKPTKKEALVNESEDRLIREIQRLKEEVNVLRSEIEMLKKERR